MRTILFVLFNFIFLNATQIVVSNKDLKYHEILDINNMGLSVTNKHIRCKMFNLNKLKQNNYQTKHYIIQGQPICEKDVQIAVKHMIRYDFGNIVIQRDGKIIGETKKFIKIKDSDGKIQKIYKNGQIKK